MTVLAEYLAYMFSVIMFFKLEILFFALSIGVHSLWHQLRWWSVRDRARFSLFVRSEKDNVSAPEHSSTTAQAPKVVAQIRKCAMRKDAEGAMRTLDQYVAAGGSLTRSMGHLVLETCASVQHLDHMECVVEVMREAGIVDVGSYNILIKTHLLQDHYDRVKVLLDEMRENGPTPTIVTYNEMVAGFARSKYPPRKRYVWRIIEQMRSAGVEPNCFTCSIILKNVQDSSPRIEVARAMELTNSLSCEMDEVLMSSIVEAYVRLGKPDQVRKSLEDLNIKRNIQATTCSTVGSLIKGYGFVNDTVNVWRCWDNMKAKKIRLSGITISCMVEAVASNGDVDRAHALIQELLKDPSTMGLIDPWVYGLVLKSYGKSGRMERMWAVYEEMLARGMHPSVVIFNVLIDACTRNKQQDRIPTLTKDMYARGCEPNLITYSTMIKGACQAGDMGSALSLLEELRRHRKLKPDEVVYKTLIDFCANRNCLHQAERLLCEMQEEGVLVTSYILTRMVKLRGNHGDVEGAFQLSTDLSQTYKFRPNNHVCNALIEVCLKNQHPKRATNLCIQMCKEHIAMEPQLMQRLVMELLCTGAAKQAVGLLCTMLKPPRPAVPSASEAVLDAWRSLLAYNRPAANLDFLTEVFSKLLQNGQEDGEALAKSLVAAMQTYRPRMGIPPVVSHLAEKRPLAQPAAQ